MCNVHTVSYLAGMSFLAGAMCIGMLLLRCYRRWNGAATQERPESMVRVTDGECHAGRKFMYDRE